MKHLMHYLAYIRERDVDEVIGIQGHEYGSTKSHASTQGIQWRIASNPQRITITFLSSNKQL